MEQIIMPSQNGTEQSPVLSIAVNNSSSETALATPATPPVSSSTAFIEANTVEASFDEIQREHIIPVFIKDNEPVISQVDFIKTAMDVVGDVFPAERILSPSVRLSHPIKGRVPEARNKPAKELLEHEKTLYYERLAFLIEVPSIKDTIDGQELSLTIAGIKAYNLDNLYSKSGVDQHFKLAIGFKVSVCTNLCIWSDGYAGDLKVKNLGQLSFAIKQLIQSFDAISNFKHIERLQKYSLTESQLSLVIGKCRLYPYLPSSQKKTIPELKFGDQQVSAVCRDYFKDQSFCRDERGEINLWRLYNLFTSANKSTYIDQFLDKGVNASGFVSELANALEHEQSNWFLS